MRYKVGDIVRVKSLNWFDTNKAEELNGLDVVKCGGRLFVPLMSLYCGKILTITDADENRYLVKEDNGDWDWTDEMFEDPYNNILYDIFDVNGMFKLKGFDPYHTQTSEGDSIKKILFDEDGNAQWDMVQDCIIFANQYNCGWDSDIAKYIHCSHISVFTKGNYTDINFWR